MESNNSFIKNANIIFSKKKGLSISFALSFSLAIAIIFALSTLYFFYQGERAKEIETIDINFVVKDGANYSSISELAKTLKANRLYSKIDSITPQMALASFEKKFGEIDSSLLPANPLPFIITATLNANNFNKSGIENNVALAKSNSIIEDVVYPSDHISLIDMLAFRTNVFFGVFACGFLLLFAYFASAKISFMIYAYKNDQVIASEKYWKAFASVLWLSCYYFLLGLILPALAVYLLIEFDVNLLPISALLSQNAIIATAIIFAIILIYSALKSAFEWKRTNERRVEEIIEANLLKIAKIKGGFIP